MKKKLELILELNSTSKYRFGRYTLAEISLNLSSVFIIMYLNCPRLCHVKLYSIHKSFYSSIEYNNIRTVILRFKANARRDLFDDFFFQNIPLKVTPSSTFIALGDDNCEKQKLNFDFPYFSTSYAEVTIGIF